LQTLVDLHVSAVGCFNAGKLQANTFRIASTAARDQKMGAFEDHLRPFPTARRLTHLPDIPLCIDTEELTSNLCNKFRANRYRALLLPVFQTVMRRMEQRESLYEISHSQAFELKEPMMANSVFSRCMQKRAAYTTHILAWMEFSR
jgi:hypothetical protein